MCSVWFHGKDDLTLQSESWKLKMEMVQIQLKAHSFFITANAERECDLSVCVSSGRRTHVQTV